MLQQSKEAMLSVQQEELRKRVMALIKQSEDAIDKASLNSPIENNQDLLLTDLRQLAMIPGGFGTRDIRKRVWPLLLGFSRQKLDEFFALHRIKPQVPGYARIAHVDDAQLHRDVDRSLNPNMWHDAQLLKSRRKRRKSLFSLLHAIMCIGKVEKLDLHYYQGLHDVAAVFQLTMGVHLATPLLSRACSTFFREPMRANFDTVLVIFQVLYPLIKTQDIELYNHITASGVDPYFALPWVITWFAHHLKTFDQVCRLYDILLCSHPMFSLYLSASLVLHHRKRILECDCDYAEMHTVLSKLADSMPIEDIVDILFHSFLMIIPKADELMQLIPPDELLAMSRLSNGDTIPPSSYTTYPYKHQKLLGVKDDPRKSMTMWTRKRKVNLLVASVVIAAITSTVYLELF
ncbi:hypothetical protein THRCLA_05920 [Thraustotheca clavata]|uniref:Rab-GAP TBC domain-containing protein n=1 Tax=Thraustotheca clavata TaxID=74557 RepID=A0A1V9ZRE5_9STRA|nr:hypothetical protein THRCLA_05920 [Thraustotheca clavata]